MVTGMSGWEFGMKERVKLIETGEILTVEVANNNNRDLEQRYYVGIPRKCPFIWVDPEEIEHLPETKLRKKTGFEGLPYAPLETVGL